MTAGTIDLTDTDRADLDALDGDDWCDGGLEDTCPFPADFRAIWNPGCDHVTPENLVCTRHRDQIRAHLDHGLLVACGTCRKVITLVRIEPIR